MKSILSFLRATLAGGIFLLLPIVLVFTLFKKGHAMAVKILSPLDHLLPETLFGLHTGKLMAAAALLVVCFLAGLIFRLAIVKKGIQKLEENVLLHFPGYALLKSKASDTLNEKIEYYISTVLVRDGEIWSIGLLIEEANGLCTVFFPKAPKNDSGDVKIIPAQYVTKVDVPTKETLLHLKGFGKGTVHWIKTN
ncbi:MAG: hypothetical protein WBB36_00030 [Chitinophagales bacterium]|nr:hypothetical protein [Saprospiraceae bacterium]